MLSDLKTNKILWLIPTCLALIAAIGGLLDNSIYNGLFPDKFIAAQYSQDWFTVFVCVALGILIYKTNSKSFKLPIVIIGIIGSLSYLYAIFSIERVYNAYYFMYLAILSSSFFATAYSLSNLSTGFLKKLYTNSGVLKANAVFSLVIAALFSALWTGALIPLIKERNQIDNLYSIYILDLAFVMPMFVISTILAFKKNAYAFVFIPVMFILGIFVIFPLGLGELAKPHFGLAMDIKSMLMSFLLAGMFASGASIQLLHTKQSAHEKN